MEASLYVHVPFCPGASRSAGGKCAYCDFYSVPVTPGDSRPERFIETLLLDAERLAGTYRPARVPTLYIGGGTPSVLGAGGTARLLRGLLEITGRYSPPPEEITVEANPESADGAFLSAVRNAGATRLSLGVQSFYGPSRRAVNRSGAGQNAGGPAHLHRSLRLAAEYFPGAFSADLITGLPFQEERILFEDIAALLAYRPAHVSLYALTLEPGTPLADDPGGPPLPGRDEADGLWLAGRGILEKAGYRQYEVSNFCLEGKESRHNIRYWQMQDWLALGPAASATVIDDRAGTGLRYTIPPDIDSWLAAGGSFHPDSGPAAPLTLDLDTLTLIKESFLMGFRYAGGPDGALFKLRFKKDIAGTIPETLDTWRRRGFLRAGKTALSRDGLLFLDSFLVDAFAELDGSYTPC